MLPNPNRQRFLRYLQSEGITDYRKFTAMVTVLADWNRSWRTSTMR